MKINISKIYNLFYDLTIMPKKNSLNGVKILKINPLYLIFLIVLIGVLSLGGGYCSVNSCEISFSQFNNVNQSNPENKNSVSLSSYDSFSGIPPSVFKEYIGNDDVVIIDIRTNEEYHEKRIANVKIIDFYDNNFVSMISSLDKNVTYLIYCRTDNRSGKTLELMKNLGFEEVYHLEGGIEAWQRQGFDIISG
ncbi:MAG: rhodanese-like domain-containing protein [Candidatus Woesearchaeota archaeon]